MPQTATSDVRWRFDLTGTSEDKKTPRSAVVDPLCSEIVGADMRTQGGPRVFPGFERLTTIGKHQRTPGLAAPGDFLIDPAENVIDIDIDEIIDFIPVSIRVGSTRSFDGFVVRYSAANAVGVALQIYDQIGIDEDVGGSYTTTGGNWKWIQIAEEGGAGNLNWDDTAMRGRESFGVAVYGRLIYFFLKGAEPRLWYVDVDTNTDGDEIAWWSRLVIDTGPGPRPIEPEVSIKSKTAARGVLRGNVVNPYQSPRITILDSDGTTELFVEPDEPLTLNNITNDASEGAEITGNPNLTDLQWDELDKFRPGRYSFAYQLEDKKTNRLSQLSELATIETDDFERYVAETTYPVFRTKEFTLADDSVVEENLIVRYETQYSASPVRGYVTLKIPQIDTSKWNRIRIYRSIRVEAAGVQGSGQTLLLDSVWDLPDSQLTGAQVTFPATGEFGAPASFDPSGYEGPDRAEWLTDLALAVQERYNNRAQFLKNLPEGGEAIVYRDTLFVSQSAGTEDTPESVRGVGELRWSSLSERSPELFPPDNLFIPTSAKDEIIRMMQVGDSMVGLSTSRMYSIVKSASSVVAREMHEGFGVVSKYASYAIGSSGFVVTPSGLVQVGVDGALEQITRLDHLLINEWTDDLENLSMAYDSKVGMMVILNPTKEEAVCMWQTSRSLSELEDMNFRQVGTGRVPTGLDDFSRAMFVRDNGAVYLINDERSIEIGGEKTTRNLETGLDKSILTVDSVPSATSLVLSGATSITENNLKEPDIVGVKLYFLDGDKKGQSFEVTATGGFTSNLLTVSVAAGAGFAAGDAGAKIGVSPVPYKVRLAPLDVPNSGTNLNRGGTRNFFQRRHVGAVGCLIEEVSGDNKGATEASYTANVLVGLEETITATGSPREPALREGPAQTWSYIDKHGLSGALLTVEVAINVPDVDFRLLSMTVTGTIEGSDLHGARA